MATAPLGAESALAYPPNLPPRAAIEAAVETLLAVLDAMDGDPDLEGVDDDTEPNGDEGDYSHGDCGHVMSYGVNQAAPIGPNNPLLF